MSSQTAQTAGERTTRTIRIIEHISLDGVLQAPGGPNEDGGYPYGGWAAPFHDQTVGQAIVAAQGEKFDLLLGRQTYDIFASYWPQQSGSMADSLNAATKYVATHRADTLGWDPVQDLGSDVVEGIRRVKEGQGLDLIVWGSSTITPLLLGHGLADELVLLVFPIVLGLGKRFFSEGVPPREFALVDVKATESGVLISTYKLDGPLRTGTIGS